MTTTFTSIVKVLFLAGLVCGLPQQNLPSLPDFVDIDMMDRAACTCGVSNTGRIVGGSEVSPMNKYPWYVAFKYKSESEYWCGGAILTEDYVVTAAHCLVMGDDQIDINGLVVAVADHDQHDYYDDVKGVTQKVEVAKLIIHPKYSYKSDDYDIALVKLAKKLDLTSHKELKPVCLPADDSQTYAGQTGHAYGWGIIGTNKTAPEKLLEVEMPIIKTTDDNMCYDAQGITERMLCAGYKEGGKDTCQGDSGGPLTVVQNGKHIIVGIVSFGNGCALPNQPGVYARVSKFLPWIKEKTADSKYC